MRDATSVKLLKRLVSIIPLTTGPMFQQQSVRMLLHDRCRTKVWNQMLDSNHRSQFRADNNGHILTCRQPGRHWPSCLPGRPNPPPLWWVWERSPIEYVSKIYHSSSYLQWIDETELKTASEMHVDIFNGCSVVVVVYQWSTSDLLVVY